MGRLSEKQLWIGAAVLAALILGLALALAYINSDQNDRPVDSSESDSDRFSREYPRVRGNNRFVYATNDEVISIFGGGTGVVFLGFPECPWCQAIVEYIDQAAADEGIERVYYLNIRQERQDNTPVYRQLLSYLEPYLEPDDSGELKLLVPDITAIKDGRIVGRFEMEAATYAEPINSPADYWSGQRAQRGLESLRQLMRKL